MKTFQACIAELLSELETPEAYPGLHQILAGTLSEGSLSDREVELIVEYAILHPTLEIVSCYSNHPTPLLNALAGIGVNYGHDRTDPYIGYKDLRFENEMIKKAQAIVPSNETLLVYGSSFNPPTKDHASFVEYIQQQHPRAEVLVVPTAISTLKSKDNYAPLLDRLDMTKANFKEDIEICELEISRSAPSSMLLTLSVLRLLRATTSNPQLTVILGFDGLKSFAKWHKAEAFGSLCRLHFYTRQGEAGQLTPLAFQHTLQFLLDNNTPVTLTFISEEECASYMVGFQHPKSEQLLITTIDPGLPMGAGSSSEARAIYHSREGKPSNIHDKVHEIITTRGLYPDPHHQVIDKERASTPNGFFENTEATATKKKSSHQARPSSSV